MNGPEEALHDGQEEVDTAHEYRLVKGWAKPGLDDPVPETDNDDEDPGYCSLGTTHDLSCQYQTLCGLARVVNVLVLRREHRLLHHPYQNDSSDPELEPEDLPPVEGADDEPGETEQDVDAAHDGVEGKERVVRDGEISVRRGGPHLQVDTGLVRVEGYGRRTDVDYEKIDSVLGDNIDRLVEVWSISLLTTKLRSYSNGKESCRVWQYLTCCVVRRRTSSGQC